MPAASDDDRRHLRHAARLALRGRGGAEPNLDSAFEPAELEVRFDYLAAFARPPRDVELEIALAHLETKRKRAEEKQSGGSTDQADREGYEDLVWVLLSTKEFLFNH